MSLVPIGNAVVRKRGTQVPTDYIIGVHLTEWFATQSGAHWIDMAYETEKFLDYHRAKGTVFKDWDAAWRNWMRRAIEWAPKKGTKEALNAITPQAVLSLFDDN